MLLQKINKKDTDNIVFTIYFYLTQNHAENDTDLRFFLQKYNLNLKRLKGKGNDIFNNEFFFSKNINFIAQGTTFVYLEDFATMMNILVSKIMVVACIYNKQLLTFSRLKKKKNDSVLTIFGNLFYQHSFLYF